LSKPGWQLTATTIYCKELGEEVTFIVQADGTATCTGAQSNNRRASGKKSRCSQVECTLLMQHRAGLLAPDSKSEGVK
jgi:hypothetical protein